MTGKLFADRILAIMLAIAVCVTGLVAVMISATADDIISDGMVFTKISDIKNFEDGSKIGNRPGTFLYEISEDPAYLNPETESTKSQKISFQEEITGDVSSYPLDQQYLQEEIGAKKFDGLRLWVKSGTGADINLDLTVVFESWSGGSRSPDNSLDSFFNTEARTTRVIATTEGNWVYIDARALGLPYYALDYTCKLSVRLVDKIAEADRTDFALYVDDLQGYNGNPFELDDNIPTQAPTEAPTQGDPNVITYEVENCNPTVSGGSKGDYNQTDIDPKNAKMISYTPDAVGNSISFTLSGVQAGTYDVVINSRDYSSRGTYQVSIDGSDVGAPVDFKYQPTNEEAAYRAHNVGQVVISETGDVELKLTCTVMGKLFVDSVVLTKVGTDAPTTQAPTTEEPTQAPTDEPTQAPTTQAPTQPPVVGEYVAWQNFESYSVGNTKPDCFDNIQTWDGNTVGVVATDSIGGGAPGSTKAAYITSTNGFSSSADGFRVNFLTSNVPNFSQIVGYRIWMKASVDGVMARAHIASDIGNNRVARSDKNLAVSTEGAWYEFNYLNTYYFNNYGSFGSGTKTVTAEHLAEAKSFGALLAIPAGATVYVDDIEIMYADGNAPTQAPTTEAPTQRPAGDGGEYPAIDGYKVKDILKTFDTYTGNAENNLIVGNSNDVTAWNANSFGMINRGNNEAQVYAERYFAAGAEGIRFWYRSTDFATLVLKIRGGNNGAIVNLPANPLGGWMTLKFDEMKFEGSNTGADLSSIYLKPSTGAAIYIDEIHTIVSVHATEGGAADHPHVPEPESYGTVTYDFDTVYPEWEVVGSGISVTREQFAGSNALVYRSGHYEDFNGTPGPNQLPDNYYVKLPIVGGKNITSISFAADGRDNYKSSEYGAHFGVVIDGKIYWASYRNGGPLGDNADLSEIDYVEGRTYTYFEGSFQTLDGGNATAINREDIYITKDNIYRVEALVFKTMQIDEYEKVGDEAQILRIDNINIVSTIPEGDDSLEFTANPDGTVTVTVVEPIEDVEYQLWAWQSVTSIINGETVTRWVRIDDGITGTTATYDPTQTDGSYKVMALALYNGKTVESRYGKAISYTDKDAGIVAINTVSLNGSTSNALFVDLSKPETTSVKVKIHATNANEITLQTATGAQKITGETTLDLKDYKPGKYTFTVTANNDVSTDEYVIDVWVHGAAFDAPPVVINSSSSVQGEAKNEFTISIVTDATDYWFSAGDIQVNDKSIEIIYNEGAYGIYEVYGYAGTMEDYYDDVVLFVNNYKRPGASFNAINTTVTLSGGDDIFDIGETATFTVTTEVEGYEGSLEYRFLRKDARGWTVLQDWSSKNTFEWKPGFTGYYIFHVEVKGEGAGSYEIKDILSFDVKGDKAKGTMTLEDITASARTPVTLQAAISDYNEQDEMVYRFRVADTRTGLDEVIRDYSPENSCVWIPRRPGEFKVYIEAINQSSFGIYDIQAVQTVTVQ